jgi:TPR repeat protein
MRIQHIFLTLLVVSLLGGCGMLNFNSQSNESVAFEQGLHAYEADDYTLAARKFRKIPTDSDLYPQALKVIRKIPYKRGKQAYEQKDYELAVRELEKVNSDFPEYAEAQEMLLRSEYVLLHRRYQRSSGKERMETLGKLVERSVKLEDSELLISSVNDIGEELDASRDPEQTKVLLGMMEQTLASKDPVLMDRALKHLLMRFDRLNNQAAVRPQMFQMIGSIKLAMM